MSCDGSPDYGIWGSEMRCKWCGGGDASGPYHGGCLDAKQRVEAADRLEKEHPEEFELGSGKPHVTHLTASYKGIPITEEWAHKFNLFQDRMAKRGVVIK